MTSHQFRAPGQAPPVIPPKMPRPPPIGSGPRSWPKPPAPQPEEPA